MKKFMGVISASIMCLTLTACGEDSAIVEAESILNKMTCEVPNNFKITEPFIKISPSETSRIISAKKIIESIRRKDSTHDWNISATMFYLSQFNLALTKGNLENDKKKLDGWINEKKNGRYSLNIGIKDVAIKQASLFNSACTQYIHELENLNKITDEANIIPDDFISEKTHKNNRMPCQILNEKNCRP